MTRRSLRARWVLPIEGPPLPGAVVTIDDGIIVALNDPSALGQTEDLGDVVLLPGLVNAHTHLEFSDLPRPLGRPGMELADWIRLVIADRKRGDRDPQASIRVGLGESLAYGVTTLGDIATSTVDINGLPNVISFQEVIGFSSGRATSAFEELSARLDNSREPTTRRSQGISPHAPYTVHPSLLERLVDESVKRDLPVAMHLAESRAELELLADGTGPFRELLTDRSMWDATAIPRGSTPCDYLRTLSRAPRVLVIHGNYLSPTEIEFLAQHRERMSVVFCPRTHAYFQHEDYPLRALLDAGVRVALGTDSRASNPDLNLLSEIRAVAERYRLSPGDALRLGTLNGAEAMGLAYEVGSLTPGKSADFFTIPCNSDDPAEAILVHDASPTRVWLRGDEINVSAIS